MLLPLGEGTTEAKSLISILVLGLGKKLGNKHMKQILVDGASTRM